MNLLDELETRVVCGDGAMGTLLLNAGVSIERCLEELCISEPARIGKIHEDYIAAGARLIQTNTFGANAVRLGRFGLESQVREINQAAVTIAKGAAQSKKVWIAGSIGPLGINAQEAAARGVDRAECFREQITALLDAAADIIFFETFTDLEEMEIALRAKQTVGDVPEVCSLACLPNGRLPCGTMLADAFTALKKIGARMVGINCMNDPQEMATLFNAVAFDGPLAVYPSAGQPERQSDRLVYNATPESFAAFARDVIPKGARLIGGCCGTTPAHIAALSAVIRDLDPR